MAKYRKKPIEIEAIQWNGSNYEEIKEFVDDRELWRPKSHILIIKTLEGNHRADIGDYIIRGVEGEFYPCKPEIFNKTYEQVE